MIALGNETTTKRTSVYEPIALDFNLYLITDRTRTESRPLLASVEEALKGGVRAVQLREKDLTTRPLLRLAYEMRELTLKYDARLFINDRVDIAIAIEADGVHLGQKSIPPYAARRLSRNLIIGVSTHNLAEALKAEADGADFITLGPVFQTPSKKKFGEPLGLGIVQAAKSQMHIPVFAIGGIKIENAKEIMDSGVDGIAMISGILGVKDIRSTSGKITRMIA